MTERKPELDNAAPSKGQPVSSTPSNPQIEAVQEHEHVKKLAEELRCLVCQNQTIADSNSGLAIDLRGQIVEQIRAGKTDVAIKEYMVERYGQFVLYNPPFNTGNAALWLGPFLLLVVGVWLALRVARKNARACAMQASEAGNEPAIDAARALEIEERYQREVSGKT